MFEYCKKEVGRKRVSSEEELSAKEKAAPINDYGPMQFCKIPDKEPDTRQKSFEGEMEFQEKAVSTLQSEFITKIKEKTKQTEEVILNFAGISMQVIDNKLPKLLDSIPFSNGLAAISFAQEVFLKFITEDPSKLTADNLENLLDEHLENVINSVGADRDGSDEEEIKVDIPVKTKGKKDKRYMAARARVSPKSGTASALTPIEEAGIKNTEEDVEREKTAVSELADKYGEGKVLEDIISHINKKIGKALSRYRFYVLLKRYKKEEIQTDEFMFELHESIQSFAYAFTEERTYLVKLVKIFDEEQEQKFYRYSGGGEKIRKEMSDVDQEIAGISKARGVKFAELKSKMEEDRKEKERKDREAMKKRFIELSLEVGEKIMNQLALKESINAINLLEIIREVNRKKIKGDQLLIKYEDYFAVLNWEPGKKERITMVDQLKGLDLLPEINEEIIKYGTRSAASICSEAVKEGWITRQELETAGKLLGSAALIGIIDSHMQRKKPAPLRAMVEQIINHRDMIKLAPPLTGSSLILDTNMVGILLTPMKDLFPEQRYLRVQLNNIIIQKKITDIRLTNMNIAELNSYGKLIGKRVRVEVQEEKPQLESLPIYAVPFNMSRGMGKYDTVFQKLIECNVGETKGNADRSMMADIYMADTEEGSAAHFATADIGIAERIGKKEGQFDPAALKLPEIEIHTMVNAEQGSKSTKKASPPQAGPKTKKLNISGTGYDVRPILEFPVGKYKVIDIMTWIKGRGYQIYVVGGAVRDTVRKAKINDVDLKTNMPVDKLEVFLKEKGLTVSVTAAINLVTAGSDEKTVDIVSTALKGGRRKKPIDRGEDTQKRDFTFNAIYLEVTKQKEVRMGPEAAIKHAESGLLQFNADPGGSNFAKRAEAILKHLQEKPENFGRALKFIERDHRQWGQYKKLEEERTANLRARIKEGEEAKAVLKGKANALKRRRLNKKIRNLKFALPPQIQPYHLEPGILDLLRKNAEYILKALTESEKGPARKHIFIHQSGFSSPMEMIAVMRRLNFSEEAMRMIYPDTVAGTSKDERFVHSRNVFPRFRPTDAIDQWNPKEEPKVKIDTTTGKIYQYRVYAYAMVEGQKEPLLIDTDYSNHGVAGHNAPHYHVYRIIDDKWCKDQSGYSNTGQPGEPPLIRTDEGRRFTGPLTWSWWRFNKSGAADTKKDIEEAARKAGLDIRDTEDQKGVIIENKITLSFKRIEQLDQNKRMPKLLQLLYNLKEGIPWNPADDTVKELTGSGGERLRFRPQLDMARKFLEAECGLTKDREAFSELKDSTLARIFDLYQAGYSKEESQAAAEYARKKIAHIDDQSISDFSNYFEYYIATARNKVPNFQQDMIYKQTVKHTSTIMAGSGCKTEGTKYEDEVKKNAENIRFKDQSTAAYHLHKHMDIGSLTAEELGKEEKLKEVALAYMKICHSTIRSGILKRTVWETADILKIYFETNEHMAVVEVDTNREEAFLLTCYRINKPMPIFIDAQYLPEVEGKSYQTALGIYKKQEISPDGNCFFNAVKRSGGLAESADLLRTRAAQELSQNGRIERYGISYIDFITGDEPADKKIETAAAFIREDGKWASQYGDLVPELMARALKRTIHILSASNGRLIQTMGISGKNPIVVFYNGSHYEAAIKQ